MDCSSFGGRPADYHRFPVLVVTAAVLTIVAPASAQNIGDTIARLASDQISGKEARSVAQSLAGASSINSLNGERIERLWAGLVQARAKFRFEKTTAKSLDVLALEILKDRDPEGHALGKELRHIIENPNYLRREEAFRAVLQFLLGARIQPSEFFDAIKILDADLLGDRDLIDRNADLIRKFLAPWPQTTERVSADVADAVSALSGPWSQMSEDRITRDVQVVGDVLGSSPVRSAADYVTAVESVSRKPVLSAMAKKAAGWLIEGNDQAVVAFAEAVHAVVISEVAQDPGAQLRLIDEDQRVESFFTFMLASVKFRDPLAKEICEKAADDLFQQNPIAIASRAMQLAKGQADAFQPDLNQQALLAELYRYYEYQAKLSEVRAAKPLQVLEYLYYDPLSPVKMAKKLQVFAGLNPDDSRRMSPAVATLQNYLRNGRIPDDSDFRRYVLLEAAKNIPHLFLITLLDQWLAPIGEWMSRHDLTADEAKVFADWMFFAPIHEDRLEAAYRFLFTASSNFKAKDPAVLALRLSATDLLKNEDRGGAVLAGYLARVLMARNESQSLRQVQEILKTFRDASYFPPTGRAVIRDLDIDDPEIRGLRELMLDERFPATPPSTGSATQPQAGLVGD